MNIMEQENKSKRARDEDNRDKTSAKKQILNNYKTENEEEEDDIFKSLEDSCTAVEVFDFPWLKEGMIFKSEDDWKFEDTFSLSVEDSCTTNPGTLGIMPGQCACQTPAAVELFAYPEDKLGDDVVDFADGIWSSLLNQPLSAGVIDDNHRGL